MVATQRTEAEKDALIAQYIAPHPHKSGLYNAVVLPQHVFVFIVLNGLLYTYNGDAAESMADYDLTEEQMDAILAYYERHKCAIDARIEAHETQFNRPLPQ